MPAEFLTRARDKFVDFMDAGERTAIGLNERAKRLKQAMFPEAPKPSPHSTAGGGSPPMETPIGKRTPSKKK